MSKEAQFGIITTSETSSRREIITPQGLLDLALSGELDLGEAEHLRATFQPLEFIESESLAKPADVVSVNGQDVLVFIPEFGWTVNIPESVKQSYIDHYQEALSRFETGKYEEALPVFRRNPYLDHFSSKVHSNGAGSTGLNLEDITTLTAYQRLVDSDLSQASLEELQQAIAWYLFYPHARVVRQRGLLAQTLEQAAVYQAINNGEENVPVLLLAAGTGRTGLDLARIFPGCCDIHITDINREAIGFSKQMAEQLGVKVTNGAANAFNIRKYCKKNSLTRPMRVVEVLGLCDYFQASNGENGQDIENMVTQIAQVAESGSVVIASNYIMHDIDDPRYHSLRAITGWPEMYRKRVEEFVKPFIDQRFSDVKVFLLHGEEESINDMRDLKHIFAVVCATK